MLPVLTAHKLTKSFGARTLFKEISLSIHPEERIGLIGPNGAGKSTLLHILAGHDSSDGTVSIRQGLKIGFVRQNSEFKQDITVQKALEQALLENKIPADQIEDRLGRAASILAFENVEALVSKLSGGWKKRLHIMCEVIKEPDLLFLDEPTNHLDLEGIRWLEQLMIRSRRTYVVITHDRVFLQQTCTRILELNPRFPQGTFTTQGSYADFLEAKEDFIHAQQKQKEVLDNRVRREIEWLRRGPKARTTKSQSRIDQAHRMIASLAEMKQRTQEKRADMGFSGTDRKTKDLVLALDITKSLGGRALFSSLNLRLAPGDRVGLLGANGCGKSTLMKVMAGMLAPDSGMVKHAHAVRIAFFDQHRETLDPNQTLKSALAPSGKDTVVYRDQEMHVVSWARRFLFQAEQLPLPLHRLSGGEQARVHLARLMLTPSDLLFLDEPTNDLDIETLEILEDSLADYPGAVLLVTHDRAMLDRVCNLLLGWNPHRAGEADFFADIEQWLRSSEEPPKTTSTTSPSQKMNVLQAPKGLSQKERTELQGMEKAIADHETRMSSLSEEATSADPKRMHDIFTEITAIQEQIERLYERWSELDARQKK